MNKQELTDEVVATIRQIIRAVDLQSKKLTKKYGLTGPQLIVLKEIRKDPNRPISEIARKISLSQATVTSILDRLEHQEFAKRNRSVQDKRKVTLTLTEKADKILDSNPSLLQEDFTDLFDKLEDWEKNMILASIQRLATMMNAEKLDSIPVLDSAPIGSSVQEAARYLADYSPLKE
ncbi:MAG: MarR family transcriptional regulator [Spirochaetales bacterium]|nr:MarR family transcriptional regulator [Spirochaetales bacterium]